MLDLENLKDHILLRIVNFQQKCLWGKQIWFSIIFEIIFLSVRAQYLREIEEI